MKKAKLIDKIARTHAGEMIGSETGGVSDNKTTCIVYYQDIEEETEDSFAVEGGSERMTLEGKCVAYLPNGILTFDGKLNRFYDSEGKLLNEFEKDKWGVCTHVHLGGQFYMFDKTEGLNSVNGGASKLGVDYFYVDAKGNEITAKVVSALKGQNRIHGLSLFEIFVTADEVGLDEDVWEDFYEEDYIDDYVRGWSEWYDIGERIKLIKK